MSAVDLANIRSELDGACPIGGSDLETCDCPPHRWRRALCGLEATLAARVQELVAQDEALQEARKELAFMHLETQRTNAQLVEQAAQLAEARMHAEHLRMACRQALGAINDLEGIGASQARHILWDAQRKTAAEALAPASPERAQVPGGAVPGDLAEIVRRVREEDRGARLYRADGRAAIRQGDGPSLCDAVESLTRELDNERARRKSIEDSLDLTHAVEQRDAAIQRAESAERERDAMRRQLLAIADTAPMSATTRTRVRQVVRGEADPLDPTPDPRPAPGASAAGSAESAERREPDAYLVESIPGDGQTWLVPGVFDLCATVECALSSAKRGSNRERPIVQLYRATKTRAASALERLSAPVPREPAALPTSEQIAALIVRNVCELPGYSSPDDRPDLLTCTVDELKGAVLTALIAAPASPATDTEDKP